MTENHIAIEELSASLDGELDQVRARAVGEHLARCARCAEELAGLELARAALGRLRPGPAEAEHVAAVLAHVERSAWNVPGTDVPRRRRVLPFLLGAVAGAAAVVLFPWLPLAGVPSRDAVGPQVRQAAALAPRPQPLPRTIEVLHVVEVPRIERVEVPVEVVRERVVQVPVEVPLPDDVLRVFTGLADALELARLGAARPAPPVPLAGLPRPDPQEPAETAPWRGRELVPTVPRPARHELARVVVRADGERTGLETRGSEAEVLPGLIALLRDPDPDVVDLAHDRLEQLRARLAADPELGPSLGAPAGAGDTPEELRAGWELWWSRNRELVLAGASL